MTQLNFLFGLGIFLYGMTQLEYGIRKLCDARVRLLLRSSTGTTGSSIFTGVISTAILQSSSMVSLLVLAFASAGLLPLTNAIGIIIGANLGTTLTGWLVALLGFKLNLEAIALPLFGIAAFILAMTRSHAKLHFWATTVLGFSLLLFGLGIMKSSMEMLPQSLDISLIQGRHAVIYLVFGIVITFLVQSSSAVMMMALAGINADFITLFEAVPLVIGADLGTTSTTALGSITGNTIKRQLAFAHFIYNFVVDVAAFFFLLPLLPTLLVLVALTDPLYSLVAFHSLMNLMGLLAFTPLLRPFSNWIEKVFKFSSHQPGYLLDTVSPQVVDAALTALTETIKLTTLQAVCNNLRIFNLKPEKLKIIVGRPHGLDGSITHQSFQQGYEAIKNQEGNILNYAVKIQTQPLKANEVAELERLKVITRHIVFSNKSLKDVQQDLQELKLSSDAAMVELYEKHKSFQKACNEKLIELLLGDHSNEFILEELTDMNNSNNLHAIEVNDFVHAHVGQNVGDSAGVSIQLNTNREIKHALKTIIKAIELSSTERSGGTQAIFDASTTVGD